MKKRNFWMLPLMVIMSLGLALSSCSTTEGVEELERTSEKLEESKGKSSGRLELCQEETIRLGVAGNLYASSITINQYNSQLFYTNVVCGATEYTWTVDGQASMTTSVPSINLEGRYFLWLPPDGCGGFNGKWEAYDPFFNPNNPCASGIPRGRYTSSLEVRANNSSVSMIIPIIVEDVEFCRDDTQECSGPDPLVPGDDDEDSGLPIDIEIPIGGGEEQQDPDDPNDIDVPFGGN